LSEKRDPTLTLTVAFHPEAHDDNQPSNHKYFQHYDTMTIIRKKEPADEEKSLAAGDA
jgi:hypothetical protein